MKKCKQCEMPIKGRKQQTESLRFCKKCLHSFYDNLPKQKKQPQFFLSPRSVKQINYHDEEEIDDELLSAF